jgi:hypothetical protein
MSDSEFKAVWAARLVKLEEIYIPVLFVMSDATSFATASAVVSMLDGHVDK